MMVLPIEKKIERFKGYKQMAWSLALQMCTELGHCQPIAKSLMPVADEMRVFANRLDNVCDELDSTENAAHIFDRILDDVVLQATLLTMNFVSEMIKADHYTNTGATKSLSVIAEEYRNLTEKFKNLSGNKNDQTMAIPEVKHCVTSTESEDFFMMFSIGGIAFVESLWYMREMVYYPYNETSITLRGEEIPVLDCRERLSIKGVPKPTNGYQSYVIVFTEWSDNPARYAVAVDEMGTNALIRTKIGIKAEPKHPILDARYIREYWESTDGNGFVFMDWNKLAE